jgi:hypothetical protein
LADHCTSELSGQGESNGAVMTSPDDTWSEWVSKARMLLDGYIEEQPNGLDIKKYELNATEEEDCRAALAVILQTGNPPRQICELLAAHFAPDWSVVASVRTIKFQFRGKKRAEQRIRDTEIAVRVLKAIESGSTAEDAWADVADKSNMSFAHAKKVWSLYKPHLDPQLF